MPHHVIIGGGPAATNAIESIRNCGDADSPITLICDEPAHSRMVLPYWLADQVPREQTYTADDDYWNRLGVTARIGTRVTKIDPTANTLSLDDGSDQPFDTLLIATGSSPIQIPIPGADGAGVQSLWTLANTESLLNTVQGNDRPRVLMIGAGFIGFIMLNAMYKRGWQLAVVEREQHVLPRMLDSGAAGLVESWLTEKGITLHCGSSVTEIADADDGSKRVTLETGDTLDADVVIVAVGVTPNLDLMDGSGIATDSGILVNGQMQTNFPHIYAAGDCAQGPALYADAQQIHAIQPTAVDHGRVAGANMAGRGVEYPGSLSMNVLDCCGLQCASYGNWADDSAEAMTICNPDGAVYRKLLWTGDSISGSIFIGRANDLGMLTDVGMVKGILQTQTPLGEWKEYLRENPFDIRRPYVAKKVAAQLAGTTLLGQPAQARGYRFGNAQPQTPTNSFHELFVGTQE